MAATFAPDALAGHTAFVTGGSRNLGRAICVALAGAGADVAVAAQTSRHDAEETAQRVRALGRRAAVVMGNIGDRDDVTQMVAEARQALGPIDILVNNAAKRPLASFTQISFDAWDAMIAEILSSAFYLSRLVIEDMVARRYGRLIFLTGSGGMPRSFGGNAHRAHVFAAKAGTAGLMNALAVEYGRYGITANAVGPGIMNTTRDPKNYPHWPIPQSELEKMVAIPRLGEPHEVGQACVYLASDAAAYVTGQFLSVSGGYS